jgi:hypothetical protein
MINRKNLLLLVLGVILAFYAGEWLLNTLLRAPLEARQNKTRQLENELQRGKKDLAQARKAGRELVAWQRQSLPSDTEVARSLYRGWLLELVQHVGLADPNVNSGDPVTKKGIYSALGFSVRGRGTLEQLTKFLFEFYSAGHLHRISSLGITPLQKSRELDLSITIEALALPEADRKDRLTTERFDRLAPADLKGTLATLDDYRSIVDRNLFAVGGGLDPTDRTYLSAVNSVDGEPEAWFLLRDTDELLKLRKGSTLQVGQFSGKLVDIDGADVILESDGQRWLLTVGDSLTDAYALPPEF